MASNPTLEKNKALVETIVDMFTSGDISDIDLLVSPDYVDHQGLPGRVIRGQAGFKEVVALTRTVPNLQVDIMDLIAEGDKVVVRLQWHSTDPTGKKIERETIDIIRLSEAQMVEHWGAEAWSSENR